MQLTARGKRVFNVEPKNLALRINEIGPRQPFAANLGERISVGIEEIREIGASP
jgi:hypothetical protein